MTYSDDRHSQIVGWLKIILPLAALALLSTLFLFARQPSGTNEIPFARIAEIARDQQIVRPSFSGVTDNGQIVRLNAESVKAAGSATQEILIMRPRLSLDAGQGRQLEIISGQGRVSEGNRYADLTGLARLETSTGYLMETEGINVDLKSGLIRSKGALEVQTPFGNLSAGQVTIQSNADGRDQQIRFTDGVNLIYRPPNSLD